MRPERRRAMSAEERALFGIDKLNVPRSEIPAVTHVDYSARIQTVHGDTNPRYHALMTEFEAVDRLPIPGEYELQRARRTHRAAHPRTRSGASWAPNSICWRPGIVSSARTTKIRR